jgi:LysM repeat protein
MHLKDSCNHNPLSRLLLHLCLATSIITLLGLFATSPVRAEESAPAPVESGTGLSPEARQAALIINRLRIEAGLPPLTVHPLLNLASNRHIQDMIATNVWGHRGSDGSNVRQRITRTGYEINGWAGENWATYKDVETSISWWMTDPPHRDNVLNRNYKEMGIGTASHPRGWGLILVVGFTTGSSNQSLGAAIVPENAHAPMPQVVVSAPAPAPVTTAGGTLYTVRAGDTLSSIGQRHGMSWQSIARANGLSEFSILQIGRQIVLPGAQSVQNSVALTQGPAAGNPEGQTYTVVAGDTLYAISMRHGLHWDDLAVYNNLSPNAILQIGEQIVIPPSATGGNVTAASAALVQQPARTYKVKAGETLWSIAATHNLDWRRLMAVNGMGENTILSIGQEITLP